jgi:hypothetical protein
MADGKILGEMQRLRVALGSDLWLDDIISSLQTGQGNREDLETRGRAERSAAESGVRAVDTIVRDPVTKCGSVDSMSVADQTAYEEASYRLMMVLAAQVAVDFALGAAEARQGVVDCLVTGYGGIGPGAAERRSAKRAELIPSQGSVGQTLRDANTGIALG